MNTNKSLRNIILAVGFVGALGAMNSCTPYSNDYNKPIEKNVVPKSISLAVSQHNNVDYKGRRYALQYNGMPSETAFSVSGESNNDVNTYFPSKAKEFKFNGAKYELISVTPDTLKVKYLPGQ